ncbi:MAG: carbohydrate ABC transporter permease [Treponema sp.]|jgi:multiple sugar transport system permease protein|nr:carbohydrate ABC transporter permease [Treponema sp.]
MKHNRSAKNQVSSVFLYLVLILVALIMFFPIMWIISSSFKSLVEINAYPPRLFVRHPKFSNYWQVLSKPAIWLYLRNTLILIAGNTAGTLLSSSLVAYPLARMHFHGEKVVFALILATMMVPATTTIIQQYLLFSRFRWLDTPLPMIVPAFFAYPYNVFLFRQFFKSIPKSMDEAALIDGCNRFQIYAKIFVPLSKSTFITIGILSSVFWWNELFQPLIYINSEMWKPLTVGALTTFKMAGSFVTQWNITMAMSTLMILPPILLYLIGQKYIVAGIKTSGMKD